MGILSSFLSPFVKILRQPVESFVRLETSDDDMTFASADGSLMSLVRIDGARQIIGDTEYKKILDDCVVKFGTRFDRPGHAIQIYFVRAPDRVAEGVKLLLRPNQDAARNLGLEIDDIFEERARNLSRYVAHEEIYFALWTRPVILTKADFAREKENSRKRKWVVARDAQYPYAAVEALRTRHKSFMNAILPALKEMGIQAAPIEVHEALRIMRVNMFQGSADSDWKPCLPGDPIPPRAQEHKGDVSELLWPSLPQQLASVSARVINDHMVEMGRHVWGGVDMVLGPQDPLPFPALLSRLAENRTPFRMSILLEGGGVQGMAMQSFLSSVLAVTNAENKQIQDSLEGLSVMARSVPVVKLRVSFCTWAPKNDHDLLEDRLSELMQAIESWGYCQVSQLSGDPLDCVMSSALGISCASTAPPGIAPLHEVMKLLPWQRASSPFEKGAILFRTTDGRVWPYQTGTNVTTTWFDLVLAQPGGGKSVLMNTLNLGTCLTAGASRLPFIAVLDIGPSSAGLISLIRDALPPSRRSEVGAFALQMTQQYAINPFDTKLGMRYPQVTERSFLIELLTLLCTPPGQAEPYDGMAQLAGMVVDEMYRWRDDSVANSEPRPYLPRIDTKVDEALREHDITIQTGAYWWDVVDFLFDKGLYEEAGLAQRYAVPTLGDAVAAARRPQIQNLLDKTSIGSSAETVIHAFERMITSAVREFPILSAVTRFSLAGVRVCALDLADVAPQGDATADRQTAIMYMMGRHALVTPWWLNEEALAQMAPKYRPYHSQRLQDFAETPKRLCYDEFHRTSSSKSVRNQLVRDVREGRKRGIQIILASQMLHDFDNDMVDLATGIWILGAAVSDAAVEATQERFGLTETARWIMRHKLTGPGRGGAPLLLVLGTTSGRCEQHLINTLGPIELWAFSTTVEDVLIRTKLYGRLGAGQARRLLAANFPDGSARAEIRRRVVLLAEKGDADKATVSAVIDTIVEEMVGSTKVSMDELQEQDKKESKKEDVEKKQGEGDKGAAPVSEAAKPVSSPETTPASHAPEEPVQPAPSTASAPAENATPPAAPQVPSFAPPVPERQAAPPSAPSAAPAGPPSATPPAAPVTPSAPDVVPPAPQPTAPAAPQVPPSVPPVPEQPTTPSVPPATPPVSPTETQPDMPPGKPSDTDDRSS